ncbi:unnamed protein product, partial [Symbiodinium sp. CCMP2592]
MVQRALRPEDLARKVEIVQTLLNETRRSNREAFRRHDDRLQSLEHLEDRITEAVRGTMDDAAQQWWARMQQHHRGEVARQMDDLRGQMVAAEQALKKIVRGKRGQLQRTAADCEAKVDLVRAGLERREARLGTLERRCDQQAFQKESSLPVFFSRKTSDARSRARSVGSAPSSPAGSAAAAPPSRCPSEDEIQARLEAVNERLRAQQASAEGRGRQAVRMVAQAQRTALKARNCSVEPALLLRVEAARAQAARRRHRS